MLVELPNPPGAEGSAKRKDYEREKSCQPDVEPETWKCPGQIHLELANRPEVQRHDEDSGDEEILQGDMTNEASPPLGSDAFPFVRIKEPHDGRILPASTPCGSASSAAGR